MRLIDADALQFVPKGTKYVVGVRGNGKSLLNLMAAVQEAIDKTPTIDAVPVVRCKDCRYRKETEHVVPHCILSGEQKDEEDFCSWGERRCDNE